MLYHYCQLGMAELLKPTLSSEEEILGLPLDLSQEEYEKLMSQWLLNDEEKA